MRSQTTFFLLYWGEKDLFFINIKGSGLDYARQFTLSHVRRCRVSTYTHLNFVFKPAFHFSTLAIKLFNSATEVLLSCNCYRNTMNQSSFKRLATCTTHPLLKLKRSVLLVMYSAYNAFCYYING